MELQEGKWGWIDVDAGPFLSSFVHLEVILFKEFTFQAKKQNKLERAKQSQNRKTDLI